MVTSEAAGSTAISAFTRKRGGTLSSKTSISMAPVPSSDAMRLLAMMMVVAMRVIMAVTVMMSTGQQPRAGDVHRQTNHRDRDRLVEADGTGSSSRDMAS